MGRPAKLWVKNGRWFSAAGGKPRYFGRVDQVDRAEAQRRLHAVLGGRSAEAVGGVEPRLTVREVTDRFLAWVASSRGECTLDERKRHLNRWCQRYGDLPAESIAGEHLESFMAEVRRSVSDFAAARHGVSVRALFRKAAIRGWIPRNCSPFAGVEPPRLPRRALVESDLPTPVEVRSLLAFADADLTPVGTGRGSRRRQPHEYRVGPDNPWVGFGDLLACFHATGARTTELLDLRVGDFHPGVGQVVLSHHKREKTMRVPLPRAITLNDRAYEIVERRCRGRRPDDRVFTMPRTGRPWDRFSAAERFRAVRDRAGVRSSVTIYGFRHLWVSEALMAGVDLLLVARMAGTSVRMIEVVYGHFRAENLREAQARLDRHRDGLDRMEGDRRGEPPRGSGAMPPTDSTDEGPRDDGRAASTTGSSGLANPPIRVGVIQAMRADALREFEIEPPVVVALPPTPYPGDGTARVA